MINPAHTQNFGHSRGRIYVRSRATFTFSNLLAMRRSPYKTFRPINSANGMAKRQRVQEDGGEHDRNKNPMDNPFSR